MYMYMYNVLAATLFFFFFSSSWVTIVDGMKDLWCSSVAININMSEC